MTGDMDPKPVDLTAYREGRMPNQNPFLMSPQKRLDARRLRLEEGPPKGKLTDIDLAVSAAKRMVVSQDSTAAQPESTPER